MNKDRPVNLSLMTIKFPSTAIVSVLHRISGFFLFLLLPCVLLALRYSLTSEDGFAKVVQVLHNPVSKVVLWVILASLAHHFIAGIRHLVMDLGWGETLATSKITAWLVMMTSFILFILIGVWLWV